MKSLPLVSVIVTFYNAEKTILNCIKSLMNQDYSKLEIIFVDSNSTDKSVEKIKDFPIKLMNEKKKGASRARNTGLRNSKGEIIAFTDSDCIAKRTWISSLVNCYTDKEVAVVGGQIKSYNPRTEFEIYADKSGLVSQEGLKYFAVSLNGSNPISFFQTANLSLRRSTIKKVGGFDETFTIAGEDVDLCWRLKNAGYRLTYCDKAIVYHKHRATITELLKQHYKYGRGSSRLFKQYYKGLIQISGLVTVIKRILIFSYFVIKKLFGRAELDGPSNFVMHRLFGRAELDGISKQKYFFLHTLMGTACLLGRFKEDLKSGIFLL